MRKLYLHLTTFMLLAAFFLTPSMSQVSKAQHLYPTFKKVSVKANAQGMANADIEYIRISNASGSSQLTKIDNMNRKSVLTDDVLAIGDQAAVKKLAAELIDCYYDGMWELPYIETRQEVTVVRGGKYVVYLTNYIGYYGGATASCGSTAECYNLHTGTKVNLDYLATGAWRSPLKRTLWNKCKERVQLQCTYDEMNIPTNCVITEFGIKFLFGQGELSCNADGVVEIELSDDELKALGIDIRW